jgi:hypothetical protein
MAGKSEQVKPFWLNHAEIAAACGVSTQAFDKWGVAPVATVGRETFYMVADVVENRLARQRSLGGRYINRAAGKHQPKRASGRRGA